MNRANPLVLDALDMIKARGLVPTIKEGGNTSRSDGAIKGATICSWWRAHPPIPKPCSVRALCSSACCATLETEESMRNTSHLTQGHSDELAYQLRSSHPGMAHWANSGPFGATCAECAFHGYFRKVCNAAGDTVATKRRLGCQKYFQLTSKHGAIVPANTLACRHLA